MKGILNRIVALLIIGTLTSVLSLAKTTKKKVTFGQSVSVNGTLVKKGTYEVTFNDETGELTIKRDRKVVATSQARLEKTDDRYSFFTRSDANDPTKPPLLISVNFKDGNLATLVNSGDNKGITTRQ